MGALEEVGSNEIGNTGGSPSAPMPCFLHTLMTPHPIFIPDLAFELQTQRSRCLLNSAAWKSYDHLQLSSSLSEPIILCLIWSLISVPMSSAESFLSGHLPSQWSKDHIMHLP